MLNRYGANYKESSTSVPPKFAIDVSNMILEDSENSVAQKVIAILLFEKVTPAEINKQTQGDNFITYR